MVYSEALALAAPFITRANADAYMAQIDQMLWVEENIMLPAGIPASICTGFGEVVCEGIEEALCALLEEGAA